MYSFSVKNFKSTNKIKKTHVLLCDTYDIYTTDTHISENTYDIYHLQYTFFVGTKDLNIHIRLCILNGEKVVATSVSLMKLPYLNKKQMQVSLDKLLDCLRSNGIINIYQKIIKQTYPTYFLKYMNKKMLYTRYIMFYGI